MKDRTDIIAGYYVEARAGLVELAERRTGSHALAEDMVHDAFLRLLVTDRMITETTLPALAYTIVRNLIADHFRRIAYGSEYEAHAVRTAGYADDVASLCSCREVEAWLERGIARLPERCREAYRLNVIGGMKIAEIQQATGESYKRLEHSLGMARKQMRLYMKRFA